jgi:hypothetical protein
MMIASKCARMTVLPRLMKNLVNKRQFGVVVTTNVQQRGNIPDAGRDRSLLLNSQQRLKSTTAEVEDYDEYGPTGDLFESKRGVKGQDLVGKTASIRRVFSPGANAQGLLTCGGEELARHASFDPDYNRARGWIRNRAVGPCVLSPVLISGLVGALVEASLPQSVPNRCSMHQVRPLIVSRK